MKRGFLSQFLALALLATLLVQAVSPIPALAGVAVSGRVFVDTAGNLLPSETIGDGFNPVEPGVTVELWFDNNGNNALDGGDTLESSVDTNALGAYSLSNIKNGDHWVVVDSRDVNNSGAVAEQTYGPAGAICTNGDGPETQTTRGAAGACYGGRRGDTVDNFDITNNAEHLAYLPNGAAASNVDFGFSYNVVSRASDSDSQGTLRRFINNANALAGANAMRFVPAVPANDGPGLWWEVLVAVVLPSVTGDDTLIDGTAFQLNDGATVIWRWPSSCTTRRTRVQRSPTSSRLPTTARAHPVR